MAANDSDRRSFFDNSWRAICWLQIAVAPTLAGATVGFLVGLTIGGRFGLAVGVLISLAGLAAGIAWAEWARRKYGTEEFMRPLVTSERADHSQRKS